MKGLEIDGEIRIMEICGSHTIAILKSGIKNILPSNIELVSGPGCPVCVTSQDYIDASIELTKRENIIIVTFGDMINVPGTNGSLRLQKAKGKDIKIVYSPLEALNIARKNPYKEVVFLGIGFETTAPITAIAIETAYKERLKNFSVFSALKTMPEAINMLLSDKEVKVDGIICPGHVSTIIGEENFAFISNKFRIPSVIAGFEYNDVKAAIFLLVKMIKENQHTINNIYGRFVRSEGNKKAKELINKIFEPSNSKWRGIGLIENSGLKIRNQYSSYDAEKKFDIKMVDSLSVKGCICGQILKGQKRPVDCSFLGKECTPQKPIGVCMVSREGACGIHYKINGKKGD